MRTTEMPCMDIRVVSKYVMKESGLGIASRMEACYLWLSRDIFSMCIHVDNRGKLQVKTTIGTIYFENKIHTVPYSLNSTHILCIDTVQYNLHAF